MCTTYNNTKIIRECVGLEHIFAKNTESTMLVKLFKIKSKFNLFQHLQTVKNAIIEWQRIHPFLQAKVVYDTNEQPYFYSTLGEIDCLDYVRFISIQIPTQILANTELSAKLSIDLMDLLIENELKREMNHKNELLWRFCLIELEHLNSGDMNEKEYEYSILLTLNHAIVEGRCSHMMMIQLLSIIDDMLKNQYKKLDVLIPQSSLNDLLKSYSGKKQTNTFDEVKLPCFKISEPKTSEIDLSYLDREIFEQIKIIPRDDKSGFKLEDLIEFSQINHSKFKFMTVDKCLFSKLMKKCKQENVKVNACLNVLIYLSYYKMNEEYASDEDKTKKIQYINTISVRPFLKDQQKSFYDYFTLGCYINAFFSFLDEPIDENDIEYKQKFWVLVRKEMEQFYERLKSDEKFCKPHIENKINWHIFMTNIGKVPQSINEMSSIHITNAFTAETRA